MVQNLRKKTSRHRGSFTHGHGEKKKRRGAGHRGGRGNAGSGKRGDAKKPSYWKNKKSSGKFGFVNPTTKKINTLTITQLNTQLENWLAQGIATKEQNNIVLDLSKVQVDKLLGTGTPAVSYVLFVKSASAGAIKKIQSANGRVTITAKQEEANADAKEPKEQPAQVQQANKE